MDDNDRLAGQYGQGMPSGGNLNDWEAGRSIRAWNDAQLAQQNAPIAIPNFGNPNPSPSQPTYAGGGGSGGASFNFRVNTGKGFILSGPLGLVLILVVGAP